MNNSSPHFSRTARQLVRLSVIALGLFLVNWANAQSDPGGRAVIEIIQIEHRDPAAIRSELMPLLDSRGSIGQLDDKLIIATTAANLLDLRSVISVHDVAPRRLVVSVDFLHVPDDAAQSDSYQYSSQAVEGEQINFVVEQQTDGEAIPATLQDASITLLAEVRGETADIDLVLANLPGFAGQQHLRVALGQWHVLTPTAIDPTFDPTFDSALDGADVAADNADPDPNVEVASIAVRVDVLP